MTDLIKENSVIIGIIISVVTLVIAIRQIKISYQKHKMDKEDFISKNRTFQSISIIAIECRIIPQKA